MNRLSYLRSSRAFLASALSDDKARFVLYDSLNPLVAPPLADGTKKLHLLEWKDVKEFIAGEKGDAAEVFRAVDGKDEKGLGIVPSYLKIEGGKDISELSSEEKRKVFINMVSPASFQLSAPSERRPRLSQSR